MEYKEADRLMGEVMRNFLYQIGNDIKRSTTPMERAQHILTKANTLTAYDKIKNG